MFELEKMNFKIDKHLLEMSTKTGVDILENGTRMKVNEGDLNSFLESLEGYLFKNEDEIDFGEIPHDEESIERIIRIKEQIEKQEKTLNKIK